MREELQHEAREALIAHMGPAHGTVRVRIRRGPVLPSAASGRWVALEPSAADLGMPEPEATTITSSIDSSIV